MGDYGGHVVSGSTIIALESGWKDIKTIALDTLEVREILIFCPVSAFPNTTTANPPNHTTPHLATQQHHLGDLG